MYLVVVDLVPADVAEDHVVALLLDAEDAVVVLGAGQGEVEDQGAVD